MTNFIKKYYKLLTIVIFSVITIYLAIYIDVTLRAKEAYYEAEKYLDWHYNPQKKIQYLQQQSEKEKQYLKKLYTQGKLTQQEYQLKLELIDFRHQRQLQESSLKYAYIWYKTAIELFSPPESKWVKLAKEKISKVKEMWKDELIKKGYKVEDYMLE
ncbi:MAG: hypothetical protein N2Z73_00210 [Endomicrobia bacterium]|nr:hypothetical protein [Endomicrobiia bacterium]